MPTLTCSLEGCDKIFHRPPSSVKKNGNFCCLDHYHNSLGERKRVFICYNCNKEFKANVTHVSNIDTPYCSKSCFYKKWKKYPKTGELRMRIIHRNKQRRYRDTLSDSYIKMIFSTNYGLKANEVSDDLIKLKRTIITAKRQARQSQQ